jgi:hypothetical protein
LNIVQITPGAGAMYCGNCFRDNALVAEWRRMGHEAIMIPLYLPMTLEEVDQSQGTPIFFSGINVFLEQKLPWFGKLPAFLRNVFASPTLLKMASGHAAKTKPADVGDLTLSMLQGEHGLQAAELETLIQWLKTQPQSALICLSNGMLAGLGRRLRNELNTSVACMLQGEDYFLDALSPDFKSRCWNTFAERVSELDHILAPSEYYADRMATRLKLPRSRIKVVYNGIETTGYRKAAPTKPTIGYFARMCPEKGLDTLIEAFIRLFARQTIPGLKLHIGGGLGPSDEPFVDGLKARLKAAGCYESVHFFPNLDKVAKQEFFSRLSVFSVPALYGEAFGLYLVEAWASGIPVVQPNHAAFPELISTTGAGLICEPSNPDSLADHLQQILTQPALHDQLSRAALNASATRFNAKSMAENFLSAVTA